MDSRIQFLVNHNLRDPTTVAQINKQQISKVAPPVNPAHEHGFLAGIGSAQFPAHMATL
jgi:hypothetical protein